MGGKSRKRGQISKKLIQKLTKQNQNPRKVFLAQKRKKKGLGIA